MATPTLLQAKSDTVQAGPSAGITNWKVNLPNPSLAGNCLICIVQCGANSASITVSDDKSNTWNSTALVTDANNQTLQIFYALNVAAGTKLITGNFGAALTSDEVIVGEFNNVKTVSALDGQAGQQLTSVASGGAITSGSFSTTVDGDLIIQAVALDSWTNPSSPRTWTPGSGMTILTSDGTSFMACQYQIQGSLGPTNPSISLNLAATSVMSKTIALQNGSSGSPNPAGIRIRHIIVTTLEQAQTITPAGTSFDNQIQVDGNTIAIAWTGDQSDVPTTVTSSPALTWNHTTRQNDPGSINTVQFWYATNAVAGTLYTVTMSGFSSTPSKCVWNLIDIAGVDTNLDANNPVIVGTNGTNSSQPTPGGTTTINGPNITPAVANGLILSIIQQNQHTATNVSPGTFQATDVGVYSGSSGDTDEGLASYYNPDTSAVQIVWTFSGYEAGVNGTGDWASQSIAFRPAVTGGPPASIEYPDFFPARTPGSPVWGLMRRLPNPAPPLASFAPSPMQYLRLFQGARPGILLWSLMRQDLPQPAPPLASFVPSPLVYVHRFPGSKPGPLIWSLMHGLQAQVPQPPAAAPTILFRKTLSMIGSGIGKRQVHNAE